MTEKFQVRLVYRHCLGLAATSTDRFVTFSWVEATDEAGAILKAATQFNHGNIGREVVSAKVVDYRGIQ